jgi:hypothetical protein
MKKSLLLFAVGIMLIGTFSCKDSSTDSVPIEPANSFVAITNVPWWLQELTLGDSIVNLHNYAGFQFSIGDTAVFGNDGCNTYNSKCVSVADSITVSMLYSTLIACFMPEQLSPYLLLGKWAVTISDTMLVVYRNDTTMTFSSVYTKSTAGQSFISKRWSFSGSNDTTYRSELTPGLIPSIKMTAKRDFGLRWYYNHQYTGKDENDEGGTFGVGDSGRIYLYNRYHTYWHAAGEPNCWQDGMYMTRVMRSDHYSYTDSTFRLENRRDGYYYDFVVMQE